MTTGVTLTRAAAITTKSNSIITIITIIHLTSKMTTTIAIMDNMNKLKNMTMAMPLLPTTITTMMGTKRPGTGLCMSRLSNQSPPPPSLLLFIPERKLRLVKSRFRYTTTTTTTRGATHRMHLTSKTEGTRHHGLHRQ
jgi:hypothetical protein